ncbi:putative zinc-type alcohol dehydrogenase-like protein YjmD [Rubripirellula lacrimiformis]|uniref:Putative zinc-type alcohol dehydrogenase-like protein YjmD n=1 Tax=Rubripirellula lacrimiformis TaxID=1930273 RepID=A0A517N9D4_9BACT|nr:glucose 1-dehydrogenase [Rubripirellula lacrimiformis]QDT03749.1 putative zinc-type alcohol dehydrogenase-like protein YjmD [Rubripirellula lacrimiformis]
MKAVAVTPGTPHSVHLTDIEKPTLDQVDDGLGVLVKVLKVGVDATDREINDALYGNAPTGDKHLVIGHESFGIVEAVGPNVKRVKPGDFVTATVRRPGGSIYDLIGTNDMTSEETYYERGINLRHGFLTEYFVDEEEYIVRVPAGLKHLHVLMEPMSCAAKAIHQAYEAQRRMKVWRPKLAYVQGAGQIGLLATLVLKLQGLEVFTIARGEGPNLKSEIVEGMEATYVSTKQTPLADLVKQTGKPDLIVDATGSSRLAFEAMEHVGHNGVVVWTGITGGDKKTEIPSDNINLDWVLGNKLLLGSVNANRTHFESGIRDLALGDMMYPGVLAKILTNPVDGLDNYAEMMRLLVEDDDALKVFVNVADE